MKGSLMAGRAILLIASLLPVAVRAEEPSPETLAKAYLDSFRTSDWKKAAGLFTREAQKRFRESVVQLLELGSVETKKETRKAFMGEELTDEQISRLSDAEFLERVLRSIMGRVLAAGAQPKRAEVVGSVIEKPGLVHVITRSFAGTAKFPDLEMEKMAIVSVEKGASGWGIGVSGELNGIISLNKARLLAAEKAVESKK